LKKKSLLKFISFFFSRKSADNAHDVDDGPKSKKIRRQLKNQRKYELTLEEILKTEIGTYDFKVGDEIFLSEDSEQDVENIFSEKEFAEMKTFTNNIFETEAISGNFVVLKLKRIERSGGKV
jgi:hypothetical protein